MKFRRSMVCMDDLDVSGLGIEVNTELMNRYKTAEITINHNANISHKTFEVKSEMAQPA
jgi:hypothetical protein